MKKIPLGLEDFKEILENDYYYVDKTLLIHRILAEGFKVYLFTRPRRFGKTLTISMLKYFFEKSEQSHAHLFENLAISQYPDLVKEHQGQYPVVYFSLKNLKQPNWQESLAQFKLVIEKEYLRHQYLLDSEYLNKYEKEKFSLFLSQEAEVSLLKNSLSLLLDWLERYHKKKVIVLLDEYDAVVNEAYVRGYYEEAIDFIRSWLGDGLKTHPSLNRGVITGVLRVAKESIFSDINLFETRSVLEETYGEFFGFTEAEVKDLLNEQEVKADMALVKSWYDGYNIGNQSVYNPISTLKFVSNKGQFGSYWLNTSANQIVKQLMIRGSQRLKLEIEELLRGNTIEKNIEEGIVFESLELKPNSIWSLFLHTGYLTIAAKEFRNRRYFYQLRIPNEELITIYENTFEEFFEAVFNEGLDPVLANLLCGNIEQLSNDLTQLLEGSVSYYDTSEDQPERAYHMFILGILMHLSKQYNIRSNREGGDGRYDVAMIPYDKNKRGFILEFKALKGKNILSEHIEKTAEDALDQILQNKYVAEMRSKKITEVLCLGLAFYKKQVSIKSSLLSLDPS